MRLTANRVKKAIKQRSARHSPRRSTDDVGCRICEPRRNAALKRQTIIGRIHAAEIDAG